MTRLKPIASGSCLAALALGTLAFGLADANSARTDDALPSASVAASLGGIGMGGVDTQAIDEMPPKHPLGRGKLKKWETRVRFSVGESRITEPFGDTGETSNAFACEATELVFPLVIEGNYTRTNPGSIRVSGMIGDRWQTADLPWKLRGPRADGTADVVLSFPALEASTIGMEISWIAESWIPTINEADAALVTWPQAWPPDVAPYLEPSTFIDSRSSAVVEVVESIN